MRQSNTRKRILSICDITPNRLGSFEEFLILLTEKLNQNIFEHVIVFREVPIKGIEEALLNLGAKIEVIKPTKYNIYNFFKFYKLIKRVQPDIVHFHFYPAYSCINYLKFFFNICIIYTDHMGGTITKNPIRKMLRKIFYYTSSKLFDGGIDKIICVSNFVKLKYSRVHGIYSKKLCVIYNGININKFKKNDFGKLKEQYFVTDQFVITCISLRKDKGAHYLIKAAPLIIKQIPKIKFILAGDGECKNYLEKLIIKLNIKDYVVFTGPIRDIEDIYSISSIVVIPSLFEEAFCFVLAEAMASETSVIAFNSGAIKEVIYDSNFIIPKNYKILSDKIIECLKNDYSKRKARQHVLDKFSLDKCVFNYINLYKKILKVETIKNNI